MCSETVRDAVIIGATLGDEAFFDTSRFFKGLRAYWLTVIGILLLTADG
jgi:hypothetical protein